MDKYKAVFDYIESLRVTVNGDVGIKKKSLRTIYSNSLDFMQHESDLQAELDEKLPGTWRPDENI